MKERLFLPLSKQPFYDYQINGKEVEIRKYGRNFTEKTVFSGRRIELRLGYSGKSAIWGNIEEVIIGSLEDIFQHYELANVEPRVNSKEDAISENMQLLGPSQKYIGFSIKIDNQ